MVFGRRKINYLADGAIEILPARGAGKFMEKYMHPSGLMRMLDF
jgi:hypothetical protein